MPLPGRLQPTTALRCVARPRAADTGAGQPFVPDTAVNGFESRVAQPPRKACPASEASSWSGYSTNGTNHDGWLVSYKPLACSALRSKNAGGEAADATLITQIIANNPCERLVVPQQKELCSTGRESAHKL